jgi:putative ABC transport system permease protein
MHLPHRLRFRQSIGDSLRAAWETIRTNRLRAFLTLLSVGIGVFSIISVMTALGVMQYSIESGLQELGANTFQVQKNDPNMGGGPDFARMMRNRRDLTYEQGLAVQRHVRGAKTIGLESWSGGVKVLWRNKHTEPNVAVAGETPGGLQTNQWEVDLGRGLRDDDIARAKNVVVIGSTLQKALFPPSINPVGETVRMNGERYTVIGTLKAKGGLFGDRDSYFIIPITTFFSQFGRHRSIHIMVQSASRENFEAVQDEVIGILRAVRNVRPGEDNDFAIFSNDSVIRQFNETTRYVRIGTVAVAGVALLAAGIGIMNIMLVSVTERTREIGVRKAVGATRRSIILQFLTEAVAVTLLGGMLGIAGGLAAGNALAFFLSIPAVVDPLWVLFGLSACTIVGLCFGTYPAWKAANLNPIEALRYE